MAFAPGSLLAAVLLLVSSGLHRSSSSLAPCPESCSCQRAPLLNCSSSGLSSVPQHIPDSVTELDLSHNILDSVTLDRPYRDLSSVWLGNNNIKQLSLCVERDIGGRYVRGRRLKHRLKPWRGGRGCVSWAPTLQLLSVERNQLEQLPQGMEGSESLQVLQLSFNKISTVQPGDLTHLRQLKELHLQHNLITSLHPQMFKDLAQLQVLDLSFNMLTSLHPLTYLSLRNIGADVMLGGNRWRCDCSMRSLRRRMAYDSSRGLQAWSMVCTSPSILSGRDLLQLEEDDLNCFSPENGPELHRDVTVYKGSEILLSCAAQDSTWWTPSGQAPVNQAEAGLDISGITETDTGLYVCVSEEHEVVSVFNLQIIKTGDARRKTRSLPRIPQGTPNRIGQQRTVTQSNLALAVSLSVLITFLIAFILGVIARPCIDALLRRVTKKKTSSAANSVSSVEQRQYDNEAFVDGEGPEHNGPHRERRVTFSTVDFREDGNVEYYDTVAGGNRGNINSDAVIECEAAEAERVTNTAGDSGSENSLRQSSPEDKRRDLADTGRAHNMEFEHIPDPVELVRRRSLSSDSSQSDKVFNEDQMIQGDHSTPKTPQLAEDSVQQRADSSTARNVEVPQISIEGSSELPGFSSEPFADWSPHTNNTNPTDLWQENEEQFEFSDSARSMSARSSGVLGSFNASKLTVAPTSDKQMTDDMSSSSSYVSEDEPTQYAVNSDPEEEDTERNHNKPEVTNAGLNQGASFEQQIHGVDSIRPSAVRPGGSFSSHSSDSDGEDYRVKKGRVPNLAVTSHSKSLDTRSPSPHAAYSSSLSSESEAEITDLKVEHNTGRMNEGIKINVPEMLSTDLDRQCIPQIKRHVDIKAPLPDSDSSSSDESTDEATNHMKKQEQGQINMDKVSQTASYDPDALDLEDTIHVKSRIDIKAPSPPPDSSSNSDSEVETTIHIKKQEQGGTDMARLPVEVSQNVSHDPQQQWPVLDLDDTMPVKNCLDVKAPSPASDSSSSSDSEDETTHHTKIERLPYQESQTLSHDPDTRWPSIDLEDTMRVKKRLDIKAPSPPPDSSSSIDSEDETTGHMKKQEQGGTSMTRLPSKVSQTASYDAQTQWPVLDLEDTMRVKKRLDIKAPSPPPDSSSNSDSEDETTGHMKIERHGVVGIAGLPYQESQTGSHDPEKQWPSIDLDHTMRIKRRLDIKAPSPPPDSSLSGGSKNHTVGGKSREAIKISPRHSSSSSDEQEESVEVDPDSRWPRLDLSSALHVKRRLDIKARSPPPESSSSSVREGGSTSLPVKVETKLPKLSPGVPYINRRLDFSRPSESNSPRSDSEDEYRDNAKAGLGVSAISKATEKEFIRSPKAPVINISRSPKTDIKLERYTAITNEVGDKTTSDNISTTPEINPELQSRWSTMNLGYSRFKKRLEISSHTQEPPNLPSTPPPDSPSSSSSESGTGSKSSTTRRKRRGVQEIIHTESSENKPVNVSLSLKGRDENSGNSVEVTERLRKDTSEEKSNPYTMLTDPHFRRYLDFKPPATPPPLDQPQSQTGEMQRKSRVELKSQASKVGVEPDSHSILTNIPHIKRALDIKAPSQRESSSSSNSEDEKIDHSVPDLSLGVPRVKRRLDVKAPLPEPSHSTFSGSENEVTRSNQSRHASNMSGLTDDDSLITYKRVIMKASLPPSNSFSPSGKSQTIDLTKQRLGDRNASLAPKRVPSLSFEDVLKKRLEQPRSTTDVDLPPEIRWRRHLGVGLSSPPAEPDLPPPDSSNSSSSESDDNIKQDKGKADVPLMHKHSSLGAYSVSLASSRALDKFDSPPSSTNEISRAASEERNERKGLSALKAMSSERRRWDTLNENLDKGASPIFDDHRTQGDGKGIRPLAKQPLTQLQQRSALDLFYGVPRYRRHDIEPQQGPPPPIPATPPPYEAVGLTWRSPQSGTKPGLGGTGNTEESDSSPLTTQKLAVYLDTSDVNISEV